MKNIHFSIRTLVPALLLMVLSACDSSSGSNTGGSTSRATILDGSPPEITLVGESVITIEGGSTFTDPGSTVSDTVDQNLVARVTGSVDTSRVGTYTLYYNVTDTSGNDAQTVTRTVIVGDTTAPVITLLGATPLTIEGGVTFVDPGTFVSDNVDLNLTTTVTGTVDTSTIGVYVLTYNVTDAQGNVANSVSRTVIVEDTTIPVITLNGDNPLTVLRGSTFTDPGSVVTDNIDVGLIATVTGTVNTTVNGVYELTYNAADANGNAADAVIRTVNVITLVSPTPSLSIDTRQLSFSWPAVAGADHYNILVNPDGISGFTVVPSGANIILTSHSLEIPVHLTDWLSAQYLVEACDAGETICASSTTQSLSLVNSVAATGYIKASNTEAGDDFGLAVAVSADGSTLAVGAYNEDSAATGVNGSSPSSNSSVDSGAVYVFTQAGSNWVQQAYIKASNTGSGDGFGGAVTLSSDGSILVVGAPKEDSATTGIDGDEADNSAADAGAAYVYVRTGGNWSHNAYLKASNTDADDRFGQSLAISGDGTTLVVGSVNEASAATGVNNTSPGQSDDTAVSAGAAYVFTLSGGTWSQQAYLKASNAEAGDNFGFAVDISQSGDTLTVGAFGEDSAATGVNNAVPGETDNSATDSGAAYVFTRTSGVWTQHSYVKASNTGISDWFGYWVAISSDGLTLAASARNEAGGGTGINNAVPGQGDDSAADAGAVYVYILFGASWIQEAYIKAPNTETQDMFGFALDLSANGNTLAVSAWQEDGSATGIEGNDTDNSATDAGAVYIFTRSAGTWTTGNYVKANNTEGGDIFGRSLAISGDGNLLIVGASQEDGASTGVGGNEADNNATDSGAAYIY